MALAMAASLLSGCSLLQKVGLSVPDAPIATAAPAPIQLSEQPYELSLTLTASDDLNPDTQARPSPVRVRIFLMEPQMDMDNKAFTEIFDFDGQQMEPRPMLTITLQPGETKDVVLPANKAQSMLVIAVAYRDPYQALWKAVATVAPSNTASAIATVGNQYNLGVLTSRLSDTAAAFATIGANSVTIDLDR
ncbi:MAG: type VI secretion system protein VasD [Pseudomonadales bacterium]|jgi:type VI secretion system protein VasD